MADKHWIRRWAAVPLGLCAIVTVSGCIGAVDRHDFNRMLVQRGSGLVSALPQEGIAALRARLGVPDFAAISVSLNASSQSADFHVRQPDRPEYEDAYSYALGTLSGPRPVHTSSTSATLDNSFPISRLTAFDRVEEIVDTALAKTGFEGGHVTSITAELESGAIQVTARVESPRTDTSVFFDQAGTFTEVKPW